MLARQGDMQELAEAWRKRLSIRATDSDARIVELSGGNRWNGGDCQVIGPAAAAGDLRRINAWD